jgi:diaminopimelate epimerase
MISISKAHAYGNDFLFVPAEQVEGLRLDELSRRLCERHSGLGGDGVIYFTIAPDGTAQMKLINTDGSPSELSGNGLRCLAALVLYRREQLRSAPMTEVRVDTEAGWKTLSLISRQGGRYTFRAAMGQPERVAQEQIDAAGETLTVTTLAHGTNVEFAVVEAPNRVRIVIWERGVGPTHASGTGACASAIAAIAHGGASRDIEVIAPGGTQRVEWLDDGVYLTGWAEVVFDGHWISSTADLT